MKSCMIIRIPDVKCIKTKSIQTENIVIDVDEIDLSKLSENQTNRLAYALGQTEKENIRSFLSCMEQKYKDLPL